MELREDLKEIIDNVPEGMNHIGIINNNAEFMNNKVGTVHCIEDVRLILELQAEIERLQGENRGLKTDRAKLLLAIGDKGRDLSMKEYLGELTQHNNKIAIEALERFQIEFTKDLKDSDDVNNWDGFIASKFLSEYIQTLKDNNNE